MDGFLKQSTASQVRTIGPFVDDTDFKTLENALTINNTDVLLKKNGAASAAKNSGGATADGSGGMYHLTWNATDTDTVGQLFYSVKVAGALVVFGTYWVLEEALYDALFGAAAAGFDASQRIDVGRWLGTAAATPTVAGVPEVDVTHFNGTAGTFAAGRPEVNTSHVSGTLQTAGDLKASLNIIDDFIDTEVAAILADTDDIQTRLPAALVGGRMDASVGAYASGMTPTRPSASGTADSGGTTTFVDTERTEADVDYWKGCLVKFTSGTLAGQVRLVTAFDPVTDTVTFAPASTVAVGTHTYELYPAGRADLHLWLGALVNVLLSGRVDANAQVVGDKTGYAIGTGGIASTSFAASAVDAAALAASGGQEIADEILNRNIAGGASGGTRNVRNALRALRNRNAEVTGTLTVYEEDDTTVAWTAAVTRSAGLNPISQVDPA